MQGVVNIPNALTFSRILILPVFMFAVLQENYGLAFALFVWGGVSDLLDGWLARRLNQITAVGKFVDPLADKLFFVFALVVFTFKKFVPLWFFITLFVRDFLVAIGSMLYIDRKGMGSINPHITGKAVNLFQFVIITGLLVEHTFDIDVPAAAYHWLFLVAAGCSLWSFGVYLVRFLRAARRG